MVGYIFLLIMALALMGFLIGLTRGKAFATSDGLVVHSRPGYHGAYIAIWVGLPPLLLVFVWLLFRGAIFDALVWQSLPDSIAAGTDAFQRRMILAEVKNVSAGIAFVTPRPRSMRLRRCLCTGSRSAAAICLSACFSSRFRGFSLPACALHPAFARGSRSSAWSTA